MENLLTISNNIHKRADHFRIVKGDDGMELIKKNGLFRDAVC